MKNSVACCHLVARLLAADGIVGEAERSFLEEMMNRLGLDEQERDDVRHFENTDGAEQTVRALPLEERERLRDELLAATLVDGKISPLERQVMDQLSDVLDL